MRCGPERAAPHAAPARRMRCGAGRSRDDAQDGELALRGDLPGRGAALEAARLAGRDAGAEIAEQDVALGLLPGTRRQVDEAHRDELLAGGVPDQPADEPGLEPHPLETGESVPVGAGLPRAGESTAMEEPA